MKPRPGFVTALVLIALGIVLLLDNLGVVRFEVSALLPFWPVLLILFAIEMIVSRARSNLVYGLGVFWAVAVIAVAIGLAWSNTRSRASGESGALGHVETLRLPLDGAGAAAIRAQLGRGTLMVGASADPAALITGTLLGDAAGLTVERREEPERTVLELGSVQAQGGLLERARSMREDTAWQLGLPSAVPLTFGVGMSSGRALVDLSDLRVTSFDLTFGRTDATITLPRTVDAETRIYGTAGVLTLEIPSGVPARIELSRRLNLVDVGPGYEALGSGYQTTGLDSFRPHQDVRVEMTFGRIRLQ